MHPPPKNRRSEWTVITSLCFFIHCAIVGYLGFMTAGFWSWRTSFVRAGVTALVLILASGITLGVRSRAVATCLAQLMQDGNSSADLQPCHDRVISMLSWSNTGLAIAIMCSFGVVFVMTVKPAPGMAFILLAVGACTGIAVSRIRASRLVPSAAPQTFNA